MKEENYTETFQSWNKVAKVYEEKFMHLPIYNETYDLFLDLLGQDKNKILEIGCGPANITAYMYNKQNNLQITGIDVAPEMIALAQKNIPAGRFYLHDARELDAITEKYDGVIAGFCIPYLSGEDCVKLFSDISRLINDGVFYCSFMHGNPKESGFVTGSTGNRMFFQYHEESFIRQEITKNNFKIVDVFHIPYEDNSIHTVIIAKK